MLPIQFRYVAWANLSALLAEQIAQAAIPLYAALALGAGAGEIGSLAAAQTLPFLLLATPFGMLADRSSRKRLMLLSEMVRAVALLGLLAVVCTGSATVLELAVLSFLGSTGTVGLSVTAPTVVPSLVGSQQLAAANSRLELARGTAFTLGPALAGSLVSWFGAPPAFAVGLGLVCLALCLLSKMPDIAIPPRVGGQRPLEQLSRGLLDVWHSQYLRPILLTAFFWNIAWFVLQSAYVPYALHHLSLTPAVIGFSLAVLGVGMLSGALLASRIMRQMAFGRVIVLGPALSLVAMALMAATLAFPSALLAAAAFFLFGAGPVVWTIASTTLRQSVTPAGSLGRVTSIFLTVNTGARPLGAMLGGWVGTVWGEPVCLVVALLGFTVQMLLIVFSATSELDVLPSERENQAQAAV